MSLEMYQHKILQLYLELELHMADLYDLFAGDFPDHALFWVSMAAEEREHASWVQYFLDRAMQGNIHFVEGKVRTHTISTITTYLLDIISRHKKSPFDIVHAAAITSDLERSLIEKNVFTHFEGDSGEVSHILKILVEGQEVHVKKIEQFAASLPRGV